MEKKDAVAALGALAHDSRLDAFRLLVQAGPEGMTPGQIAERLQLPSATLSFHLNHLKHAGLVTFRREGRSLVYLAEYAAMNALLSYLTENCCQGTTSCGVVSCDGTALVAPSKEDAIRTAKMPVTIYHNPNCGTSRNVLAMIRNSGEKPQVIEYLKTPPTRAELADLIRRMGIPVRALLREKGTPFHELGLDNPALSDDALLDAMIAHPILINRPIVVTQKGVRLCRPSETVLDILPAPQRGTFTKEDGEPVTDASGQRI